MTKKIEDNGPELIPGKSYKYRGDYVYYFVGFNDKGQAVFCQGNNPFILDKDLFTNLVEYKEPKRGTVWLNIASTGTYGEAWASKTIADMHQYNSIGLERLACIEVPWVEGQGI